MPLFRGFSWTSIRIRCLSSQRPLPTHMQAMRAGLLVMASLLLGWGAPGAQTLSGIDDARRALVMGSVRMDSCAC